MTINVFKENEEYLIYSYDESDWPLIAAMSAYIDGYFDGLMSHPFFPKSGHCSGFDLGGSNEQIKEFFSLFGPVFKSAYFGEYIKKPRV